MSAAMTLLTPDRQKLLEATDTTSRLAQLVGLIDTRARRDLGTPLAPRNGPDQLVDDVPELTALPK